MDCNISTSNENDLLECQSNNNGKFQQSAVNKVCFVVAIAAMAVHCAFVTVIRNVRMLYGSFILTNLYMMLMSYVFFMASCSLTSKPFEHGHLNGTSTRSLFELFSQFCFLSSVYWNLTASCQVCLLVYRGCQELATYKLFDCLQYLLASIMSFLIPAVFCYIKFHFESHPKVNLESPDILKMEIECNLAASTFIVVFFFIPMMSGILASIAVLVTVFLLSRDKSREDRLFTFEDQEVAARYGMCCKLTLTYLFIWIVGISATHLFSASLWNVFTLLCSLQGLYIIINFIFSRPVLDRVHRWRDSFVSNYQVDFEVFNLPRD